MTVDIHLPSIMKVGGGAISQLQDMLATLGVKRPCIIADPIMVTLGKVENITSSLSAYANDIHAKLQAHPHGHFHNASNFVHSSVARARTEIS